MRVQRCTTPVNDGAAASKTEERAEEAAVRRDAKNRVAKCSALCTFQKLAFPHLVAQGSELLHDRQTTRSTPNDGDFGLGLGPGAEAVRAAAWYRR